MSDPASTATGVTRLAVLGDARSCHVINRTEPFSRLGIDVTLLTEARPARAPSGPRLVDPAPSPLMFLRLVAFFRNYVRILRRLRPDAVIVHYAQSQGGWAAAFAEVRPLVVSVMGGDVLFDEQGNPPYTVRWLTRELLRRADAVIAVSDYLIAAMTAMGIDPAKMSRVIWMVDRERFRPIDGDRARERFGVPAGVPVVLSPKSLEPFYNHHVLVEAMPEILARHPDARFVFTGQFADPSYRDRLLTRMTELGVVDHAILVGAVDNADMPELYALASVSVGLPPSDGMPMTVLEAMACGVPNVMADVPNVRELAVDGVNASLVAIEPTAVARAVSRLLARDGTAARIVAGGTATLDALPTLDEDVAGVLARIRALKRGPPRRAPAWRRFLIFQAICNWHLENSWHGNRHYSRPPRDVEDFERFQPLWLVDITLRFLRRPRSKWRERFLDPILAFLDPPRSP